MKRSLLLLAFALFAHPLQAQERPSPTTATRILSVGCSYSIWHHWPHLLGEMLVAGKHADAVEVVPMVWAGAPLIDHHRDGRALKWIQGTALTPADAKNLARQIQDLEAKAKNAANDFGLTVQLRENQARLAQASKPGWDYVFLLFFTKDYAATDEEIDAVVKDFVTAARKAGSQPIVWLPWGGTEDVKRYVPLAKKFEVPLIPVSFAEQWARNGKLEAKTRVAWSGGHPDGKTAYLYACTFYGFLTGKSPVGLPIDTVHTGDVGTQKEDLVLSKQDAIKLQNAAWQAVLEYRKLEAEIPTPLHVEGDWKALTLQANEQDALTTAELANSHVKIAKGRWEWTNSQGTAMESAEYRIRPSNAKGAVDGEIDLISKDDQGKAMIRPGIYWQYTPDILLVSLREADLEKGKPKGFESTKGHRLWLLERLGSRQIVPVSGRTDLERMQGSWQVLMHLDDAFDRKAPGKFDPKKGLHRFTVAGDRFEFTGGYKAKLVLDPTAKPGRLVLHEPWGEPGYSKDGTLLGIYEFLDEDTLRICHSESHRTKDHPTRFRSDGDLNLTVLRRFREPLRTPTK